MHQPNYPKVLLIRNYYFDLLTFLLLLYDLRFLQIFIIAVLHFTASVAFSTSSSDDTDIELDNFFIERVRLLNVSPTSSTPSKSLFNLATLLLTSSAISFVFSSNSVVSVVIPSTCRSTPSNVSATLFNVR